MLLPVRFKKLDRFGVISQPGDGVSPAEERVTVSELGIEFQSLLKVLLSLSDASQAQQGYAEVCPDGRQIRLSLDHRFEHGDRLGITPSMHEQFPQFGTCRQIVGRYRQRSAQSSDGVLVPQPSADSEHAASEIPVGSGAEEENNGESYYRILSEPREEQE